MSGRVCIVDSIRTPFVKAGANLKDVPAYELGRVAVTELLVRNDHPDLAIDAVMLGNIIGPAEASNVARVIALYSGLPRTTPAYTINMNCASGLLAVAQGAEQILAGKAKSVIVGGTESMSNTPLHFPKGMSGFLERMMRAKSIAAKLAALSTFRPSFLKPIIALEVGLTDPVSGMIMGGTAEVLAKRYRITREEQDRFAIRSHELYFKALSSGFYEPQIVPVYAPPKYKEVVAQDIGPRNNVTLESLGRMRPYFDRKFGTVTIGNSCPITDGAAAMLLMEEETARRMGYTPEFFIRGSAFRGISPEIMGLGPAISTPHALKAAGCSFNDIQLIEINEAFAAQIIANERVFASEKLYRELTGESSSPLSEIDRDKLNINGGAIALGHPVGTSGTRIVMNLIHAMKRRDLNLGLAAICVGGGLGGAMVIERI